MKSIIYFYRRSHSIYFSIEKLFHAIAAGVREIKNDRYIISELCMPFKSSFWSIYKNIRFARRSQGNINHFTGDVHYAILGCKKSNINILTIHDCVLLHHYSKINPRHWLIRWLWYRLPIKKADIITVISENTKQDLLKFTDCSPNKIRVISNFVDPLFKFNKQNEKQNCFKLLFIGTAPNKNLERVIESILQLNVELIIVGYLNQSQVTLLESGEVRYRVLHELSELSMCDVYAESDILMFPSTYEGFGLPIVEAQATGRPVLTSNIEPMASVSGGAACLVDPFSVDSIRSGLKEIMGDESYRNQLVEKGFDNIKRFQIENVIDQYEELYKELIKRKAS